MRSSGAKGWPLRMPMEAKRPDGLRVDEIRRLVLHHRIQLVVELEGRCALMVLNCLPEVLTKSVAGGLAASRAGG